MKTIYTDRLGLYPLVLLALPGMSFWSAYASFTGSRYAPFGLSNTLNSAILVAAGVYLAVRAAKRLRYTRSARREGRDPTIIRIKD